MQTRRQLLRWMLSSSLTASSIALTGCTQRQPVPFQAGKAVRPPPGCADLRANNSQGDC